MMNRYLRQSTFLLLLVAMLALFVDSTASQRQRLAFIPHMYVALEDPPSPPRLPSNWLDYVNFYRAMAGLPAVAANTDWARGNELHGRYSVKNDNLIHDEDPANAWYTAEGQQAARSSNLMGSYGAEENFYVSIDAWMQAPFHAIGILDPQLNEAGYGEYSEADGRELQFASGLDVLRGLGPLPDGVRFPVLWPGPGATVPLTEHWGEWPSPLTSCPGYKEPSGLPLLVQIGIGDQTPHVTAHSFSQNGTNLEHCVFDETNYKHPDPGSQAVGRTILDGRDAIVLIPREPLQPGATYDVSLTVNGHSYSWSFSVANTPRSADKTPLGRPPSHPPLP